MLSLLMSNGSSESSNSGWSPSIAAILIVGISVVYNADFTANETASKRLPPHSKI